mgnify:CR=1 FL=1
MSGNTETPLPGSTAVQVLVVSGLSGSGKSVALKTFEDLDYYCVDNLPVDLLPSFVRSLVREDELPPKIAVGIDVRSRHNDLSKLAQWRAALAQLGKVDSIQVMSHGAAGQFTLGNRTVTTDNVDQLGQTPSPRADAAIEGIAQIHDIIFAAAQVAKQRRCTPGISNA